MQKVNLCEACSKEKGVTDPTGFALTDLLLGLGAAQEFERANTVQKCPACEFTQNDFKKTGRLGCAVCYDTFAEGLGPLLKSMHKGTFHTGKIPARQMRSIQLDKEIRLLREELQAAVQKEKYEAAADLRDRIRLLETSISS